MPDLSGKNSPPPKPLTAEEIEKINKNLENAFKDQKLVEDPDPISQQGALGCFADKMQTGKALDGRDLDGEAFKTWTGHMSKKVCKATCKEMGFKYAGTQNGDWCMRGNSYGKHGKSTACKVPCTGDKFEICGCLLANAVYDVAAPF